MTITSYFGFDIDLCEQTGQFSATRNPHESIMKSMSLPACKRLIDEFVEGNKGFAPFKMVHFEFGDPLPSEAVITVIGIDKAGQFLIEVTEDNETQRQTIFGVSDEVNYLILNEEDQKIVARIKEINKDVDVLFSEINTLKDTYTGKTLQDIRKELGIIDSFAGFRK